MGTRAGGRAVFGFEGRSVVFEMQTEELAGPTRVRWECDGGTAPEWVGTTQDFQLEPQEIGEVLMKSSHSGWKPGSEYCYFRNTTWGHLLVTLKKFAETAEENPYCT